METNKNIRSSEDYINSAHRLGRAGGAIALVVMLALPTIAGIYFNAMPSLFQIFTASSGLLGIFVPIAISEVVAYTPILGSSIYLTLVTGNVTNLKIPVVNNALTFLDVKSGSEDADVVGAIAVSVSTLFTLVLIALGVALMVPLQPVLTHPAVETATGYILPSLFGAMLMSVFTENVGGGIKAVGRLKGAILPAILVLIINIVNVYVLNNALDLFQGFIILVMLPVAWFGTKHMYRKGTINVYLPGETIPDKRK